MNPNVRAVGWMTGGERLCIIIGFYFGVHGNKIADLPKKAADSHGQILSFPTREPRLFSKAALEQTGKVEMEIKPLTWTTFTALIVMFRMRTGYCGLNKHVKRMGLDDKAACQCGVEEQTPHHILQSCNHLEELRQKTWSLNRFIDHTLWGTLDDLHKTMQYTNASGHRI